MSEKCDDLRFYDVIRARIEHEDHLIVQRLSWFMASQAFLFTAYAIALNGSGGGKLLRLVPGIGIVTAALIYVGIFAALSATRWIHRTFKERGLSEGDLGLPLLITPARVRLFGLAAPTLLPGVFLAAWAYLLLG